MNFIRDRRSYLIPMLVIAVLACAPGMVTAEGAAVEHTGLGVIRGVVKDQAGSGIADATVAVFKVGTSELLKQVKSASDGSFVARLLPGTYTVLAVAEGYNPVTLASVDVSRSADLVYGFKLVRAGAGNTLPEKSLDRNSSKWRIRAASPQRTIYQNVEGKSPVDGDAVQADSSVAVAASDDPSSTRRGQTVVETYFASTGTGSYSGLDFATFVPIAENAEIILAGQTSTGKNGPSRLETQFRIRPNSRHQVSLNASAGRLGTITSNNREKSLGQMSFQALDQWTVREGVILVFGADYSRLMGAGSDSSFSPRLGLQFDVDAKTRFRASYTTQTEQKSWADAIDLEDTQVAFQEAIAVEDLVVNGHPQLNKSRRIEFGIERVLDNKSSIETAAFFDTTLGRGVGLANIPLDTLDGTGFGSLVANQQGKAQGMRVVYNRHKRPYGISALAAGNRFCDRSIPGTPGHLRPELKRPGDPEFADLRLSISSRGDHRCA
jgi:Carboxypeptidase regulatory-like domain/TonB dependent receptor